jgi:hypothetical protein
LRLWACAACREVWHLLSDERSRQAVLAAERYADRLINRKQLADARRAAEDVYRADLDGPYAAQAAAACRAATGAALTAAKGVGGNVDWDGPRRRIDPDRTAKLRALAQDIFGLAFHPVAVSPPWLAWNDGTVLKLAQAIYDEQAFERLPLLADALEDAACTDAKILAHCRGPGPHARGCWVIDLLLGRQ